jgi:hypothetical protein
MEAAGVSGGVQGTRHTQLTLGMCFEPSANGGYSEAFNDRVIKLSGVRPLRCDYALSDIPRSICPDSTEQLITEICRNTSETSRAWQQKGRLHPGMSLKQARKCVPR